MLLLGSYVCTMCDMCRCGVCGGVSVHMSDSHDTEVFLVCVQCANTSVDLNKRVEGYFHALSPFGKYNIWYTTAIFIYIWCTVVRCISFILVYGIKHQHSNAVMKMVILSACVILVQHTHIHSTQHTRHTIPFLLTKSWFLCAKLDIQSICVQFVLCANSLQFYGKIQLCIFQFEWHLREFDNDCGIMLLCHLTPTQWFWTSIFQPTLRVCVDI